MGRLTKNQKRRIRNAILKRFKSFGYQRPYNRYRSSDQRMKAAIDKAYKQWKRDNPPPDSPRVFRARIEDAYYAEKRRQRIKGR